jgi:hypothetical protein
MYQLLTNCYTGSFVPLLLRSESVAELDPAKGTLFFVAHLTTQRLISKIANAVPCCLLYFGWSNWSPVLF